ncbi:MAG: phytoene/squalene synthase family protein [Chthoniobacterales bacterium]
MESSNNALSIPRRLRGSVCRRSSNLIPALLLLPGDRRSDALLFGEWCRLVDDIADSRSLRITEKQQALKAWSLAIESSKGLPNDFLELIRRRHLDSHLLLEVVRGMTMDTEKNRYADFEELQGYCQCVASAVGLLSARIFGAHGTTVERYAEQLGIALQLTNILRDVVEDASVGRIYIPRKDLERFGVSEREILESTSSPSMTHLLNHQAERADSYFAKAESAWSEMTVNQRRLMRPARLMSAIYRDILLQMHCDRYDVFAKRYRVPLGKKFLLLLRVMTARNSSRNTPAEARRSQRGN